MIADQHLQQIVHIEHVCLCPLGAAANFYAGGINHQVGNPMVVQIALQSDSIPTGLIADQSCDRIRQSKSVAWLLNLPLQRLKVSRLDRAYPWSLTHADREAKFPLLLT